MGNHDVDVEDVKRWLKKHEGYRRHTYKCSTGHWTIGWGRNLDDKGILTHEAEFMLNNDVHACIQQLSKFNWFSNQPPVVKNALINMRFNLGLYGLLQFKKMIKALDGKNYDLAATEALDSKWAKQVHQRALDVASMIRKGNDSL